ncbi:uncharacterized protein LOC143038806 isoform X1 [Oratosquilla oratoria]|uniref:uncharacterized protein LOC143038806 isoform X1 n=1 Tax=Oratosquilla oratoria TaxID=337810 RepID=UPI003F77462E
MSKRKGRWIRYKTHDCLSSKGGKWVVRRPGLLLFLRRGRRLTRWRGRFSDRHPRRTSGKWIGIPLRGRRNKRKTAKRKALKKASRKSFKLGITERKVGRTNDTTLAAASPSKNRRKSKKQQSKLDKSKKKSRPERKVKEDLSVSQWRISVKPRQNPESALSDVKTQDETTSPTDGSYLSPNSAFQNKRERLHRGGDEEGKTRSQVLSSKQKSQREAVRRWNVVCADLPRLTAPSRELPPNRPLRHLPSPPATRKGRHQRQTDMEVVAISYLNLIKNQNSEKNPRKSVREEFLEKYRRARGISPPDDPKISPPSPEAFLPVLPAASVRRRKMSKSPRRTPRSGSKHPLGRKVPGEGLEPKAVLSFNTDDLLSDVLSMTALPSGLHSLNLPPVKKDKKKRSPTRTKTQRKKKQKAARQERLLVSQEKGAFWYEVTARVQLILGVSNKEEEEEVRRTTRGNKSGGPKRRTGSTTTDGHAVVGKRRTKHYLTKFKGAAMEGITKNPEGGCSKNPARVFRKVLESSPSYEPTEVNEEESEFDSGSENAKKGGAPAATAKKTRKGKRKRDTATLDDPGQTGVSRVGDSRSGSSKGRGGSSSTRSSSSMGRHKNVEGDIQSQAFDPKRLRELQAEMIQVRGENEESEEMIRLKAALDGTGVGGRDSGLGGSTYSAASRGFWLDLPRAPSHRAAVFTLPAQMTRLQGISALEYLHRYVRLRSSRKLLHSTVFTRHRDVEAKGEWMKKSDLETALSEALGGKVESCHMDQLEGLLTLPPEHVSKEQFSSIAALAERLFCNELLPTPTVEVEPRDLVEQLDFSHLENKLEGLVVDEPLKALLTTISSLT